MLSISWIPRYFNDWSAQAKGKACFKLDVRNRGTVIDRILDVSLLILKLHTLPESAYSYGMLGEEDPQHGKNVIGIS